MRTVSLSLLSLFLALAPAAAAEFPDPEKLPVIEKFPDPLVMHDGTPVRTAKEWNEKRRPELKALIQHYEYGTLPAPVKVTAKVDHEDRKALGGKATLREVSLTLHPKAAPVRLLLVVPNNRPTPVGVFVGMNFSGNHTLVDDPAVRVPTAWMYGGRKGVKNNRASEAGRGTAKDVWAIDQTVARGYAVATFYNGDSDPDRKEARGGLRPYLDPDEKAGTIMFWAWTIMRAVDYLVTLPELDPKRVIVVGHSRLGKTALVAAAFDERIALSIPHQAGCGGTAPCRQNNPKAESVKRINTSFPHWFNANFKKFNDNPARLPFDQHSVTALVAPRPVLFSNAVEDQWANPDGQFEILKAAEPVWKLLGAGGLESPKKPAVGTLSAGKLGYFIREGQHSMTREDWKVFLDFADKHLGKKEKKTSSRTRRLLLIGTGPDGHPPRTHEYVSGLEVLARSLKGDGGLEVMRVRADGAWKEGPELIARADAAVLFLAEGAKWLTQDRARYEAVRRLLNRGGGVVVLHWAMGTREAGPIKDFVALAGGCHGGPDRKYKVVEKARVAVAGHPIGRGLKDFEIKDEFYYRLKMAKGVEPVLRVRIGEEEHVVAWAYNRPEGGRAFGFSGLHFHDNWEREEYRRLVMQGTRWVMGVE